MRRKKKVEIPKIKIKKKSKEELLFPKYIILSFSENPWLYAIQRKTENEERFLFSDPDGSKHGEVYQAITYIVSPFLNYNTNRPGESCTCLAWRTNQMRCIHLKKFWHENPHLKRPHLIEDTELPVNALIRQICKDIIPTDKTLQKRLKHELTAFAIDEFHNKPEFRNQLKACWKLSNASKIEKIKTTCWFIDTLTYWAGLNKTSE